MNEEPITITVQANTNCKELLDYKFQCHKFNIITETWLCGPALKDSNKNKFDGSYPAGFLKDWKNAFTSYIPKNVNKILHVCAGSVRKEEGKTLDIDPKYNPDYLCNAETFRYGSLETGETQIPDNTFEWELADPPYNKEASEKYYNKPLLKKSMMIKQMARTTKVGGFIGILDQIMPQGPPRNLKCVARIGVTSVPNLDMRIFTVFKKIAN